MYKSLLFACLCLITFNTKASVIYSYTGSNYTLVSGQTTAGGGGTIESLYDTTMRIAGVVELDSALATNLDNVLVSPISAVFSDGVITKDLNNLTIYDVRNFRFSTDTSGNITAWDIEIYYLNAPTFGVDTTVMRTQPGNDVGGFQRCIDIECTIIEEHGGHLIDGVSGTWTVVPIPAATWLFGFGLLGLIGMARRTASV